MSGFDAITTPLIEFFESLGYSSDSSNGRKIFRNYVDTEVELNSLYNGVGLRDISHYGILELKGKDVLDYLHRISTNTLKDLQKEFIARTILTTEKGRIIDVPYIVNFETQQLCICSSHYKQKVKGWLNKYVIADDVSIADIADKYVLLELLGPQADSYAMLVGGTVVNNLQHNTFKVIHSDGMLFFLLKIRDNNDRTRYWFIADQDNGKLIINYMLNNRQLFDFNLIGEEAYNIYRIEQGLPEVPNEINDTYNPHEVKLTDLVDTKKGCYIGQEVIARLETYDKIQRILMGIKLDSSEAPSSNELVDENGAEAGMITSVVYSRRCKSMIALAFIRRGFAEDGYELQVKQSDLKATVKSLPFRK
jgi:tRNA-modifying protein YgfZ